MEISTRKLVIYLVIAFGGAWALQAAALFAADSGPVEMKALMYQGIVGLSMFMPLIATVIVSKGISSTKTGIKWGVHLKGKVKWVFIAWFGPLVFTILGAALYFAIFSQDFNVDNGYLLSLYPAEVLDEMPFPPSFLLVISLISAITYGPAINTFFAVGEEAGWRGFMAPALMQKLGRKPGLVVGGIIWGAWHWPIIIFAGYQYGIGYFGAPFTGLIGMCLFTLALGILLQYLYEKSSCIWIPALAHGALNAVAGLPLYFMPAGTTHYLLGPTIAGLISVIPLLVVALVILFKSKNTVSKEIAKEAHSTSSQIGL